MLQTHLSHLDNIELSLACPRRPNGDHKASIVAQGPMLLISQLLFWWPLLSLSLREQTNESGGAVVVPVAQVD
jgi:hypothetical protein